MGNADNWWVFPGFKVERIATGFDLPVNLAFKPEPSPDAGAPFLYVTELYNGVKAVTNDGTVLDFAPDLLNYHADYDIPGSGESGVTGLCVEPKSGDVYASLIYTRNGQVLGKVIRMTTSDGLRMTSIETVIDGIPSTTKAHQIQAVTFGPDGMLYVNVADGGNADAAQDWEDMRGKVLRLTRHGCVPPDNPMHGNSVYALGFRNPFGATWRKSDRSLYVSVNGPDRDDIVARVRPGTNHGWPMSMRRNASFVWEYTQAPTALAFAENGVFGPEYEDHLFVALFGNSYKRGRDVKGKKIVKMKLNPAADSVETYDEFVTYLGDGPASPCGLAFGPDGMYFTDLHGEPANGDFHGAGSIYRVTRVPKHATSELDGVMLAESDNYELVESYVYFPPDSVDWSHFTRSRQKHSNPRLGEGVFWNITVGDKTIENAAWSFSEPKSDVSHIKDYVSFAYGETSLRTERSG